MQSTKPKDFLLYSTGTAFAYKIAKDYYNNIHYVWCTDSFDAILQPGTSNPRTLCSRYLEQIVTQDRHATEIENNKAGILKGATAKLKEGIITEAQLYEIQIKLRFASMEDFYPIIYLIDKKSVKKRLLIVNPNDKASDTSVEYIIPDLKRNEFEVIHVKDMIAGIIRPIDD